MLDPAKVREYECAFRGRFEPPAGPAYGWSYGANEDELAETIAFICDHWDMYTGEWFARYATYPESFAARVREKLEKPPHPIDCLTLARVALHAGLREEAFGLTRSALDRCPEQATALKQQLTAFLGQITSP